MRVTRLKLSNVRAIEAAEFHFTAGFNLIVGVNGVGKTTVLHSLTHCLHDFVTNGDNVARNRARPGTLGADDVRIGAEALDVECDVEYGGRVRTYVKHVSGNHSGRRNGRQRAGGAAGVEAGRPFALFFSTRRAVPGRRSPAKGPAAGGMAAALAGAFSDRHLGLAEFAAWMRTRQALAGERATEVRVLQVLDDTVARFLPDYRNLRPSEGDGDLSIDRRGTTISVRRLSDGERGVLALVLDLARRLSQANPALEDPTSDAGAVVLIDELELHLHPAWQRRIMTNLTAAFPRCQFIATTHSPQAIGEIERDHVHLMADGDVYSPSHSFGVDSSRVLEEIMDTGPRTRKVTELLRYISGRIDADEFERARCSLSSLTEILGENDPEVTRLRTLLDFMEGN